MGLSAALILSHICINDRFRNYWHLWHVIGIRSAYFHGAGEGRTEHHGQPHFSTVNYTKFLFWIIENQSAVIALIYIHIYRRIIIYYSAIPLYNAI